MRARRLLPVLFLILGLGGCAGQGGVPTGDQLMTAGQSGASHADGIQLAAQTPAAAPPKVPRKIVYTAQVDMVTPDLTHANAQLAERVRAHRGYVAARELNGAQGDTRRAVWKVRVPVAEFESFLSEVQNLGELQKVQTGSQDVTDEYYDLDARLANKRVEEKRLLQHLAGNGGRLQDILAVERELSRVRGEVESLQGKLKLMASQTEMTTVDITLSEAKRFVPGSAPGLRTEAARTFSSSVHAMGDAFEALALVAVALAPWLALAGLLLAPVLVFVRWRRRMGVRRDVAP